jgi:hypothetical protein
MGEDVARNAEARAELPRGVLRASDEGPPPGEGREIDQSGHGWVSWILPTHAEPANATVLPEHLRTKRPVLPPGSEPTEDRLREALDACVDLDKEVAQLRLRLDRAERERDEAKAQCRRLNRGLDDTHADLLAARDELLRSRSWQVARNDAAGPCLHCGQPIVRGQAFEPVPTTDGPHPSTKGRFRHCCCPNPEPTEGATT